MPTEMKPRYEAIERSGRWIVLDHYQGVLTICRSRQDAERLAIDRQIEANCERFIRHVLEA